MEGDSFRYSKAILLLDYYPSHQRVKSKLIFRELGYLIVFLPQLAPVEIINFIIN